jgi:phosphoethanolamine N-methyltransferase
MQKWLKPGGRLLITDYCCKEGPHSPEYASYVEQRHYHVLSPQKYGELLSNVGFVNVRAEDRTEQFVQVLQTELARIKSIENEFTKVNSNVLSKKSAIPVVCQ